MRYKSLEWLLAEQMAYERLSYERLINAPTEEMRRLIREIDEAPQRILREALDRLYGQDGPTPEEAARERIEAEEQAKAQADERRRLQSESGRRGARVKQENQMETYQERNQCIRGKAAVLKPVNESWATIIAKENDMTPARIRQIVNKAKT